MSTSESAGTYADQVMITFNQVSDLSPRTVLDSFEVKIHPHGNIDLDWLSAEIRQIFLQPEPDPQTGIRYLRDNYVLTQRQKEVHWGASGATVHYIVDTASRLGLDKATVGAVVGVAIKELYEKLKSRGYEVAAGKPEMLSDDEAIRFGLQAIEADYKTKFADLKPKSVGKNEFGQHVIVASDTGGSTYTVTFVVRGGVTDVISREHALPTDD